MSGFIEWAASNDYFAMWGLYLLGVVGLLIVIWRLTRRWPTWLTVSLRVLFASLLLAPINVAVDATLYAPAIIVAPFEWLVNGPDLAAPAIAQLITLTGTAVLVLLLCFGVRWLIMRQRKPAAG